MVSQCQICQIIIAGYQVPSRLLQNLILTEWKWGMETIDFVIGRPTTSGGKNAIWLIMDRLTTSSHFLVFKKTNTTE